ncbi:MAG: hypothetical protein ACYDHW_06325 [Syntrophorhabdaceae bacterium]
MKKNLYVGLVLVLIFLGVPYTGNTQVSFETHKITDTAAGGRYDTYNGTIAWLDISDRSIHYWDGATTQVIDPGPWDNIDKISLHNGQIAWDKTLQNVLMPWSISFWDGSSIRQITDGINASDVGPSLYNGTIAWSRIDAGVMFWDGNQILNITQNHDGGGGSPALYNGKIAFGGSVENPTNPLDQRIPQLFYWDGQDIIRITDNSTRWLSSIDLYDGHISWAEDVNTKIRYWDASSVKDLFPGSDPSLDNGRIVYNLGTAIYYYDGNNTYKVSEDGHYPKISGDMIVWSNGDSLQELYYAKIIGSDQVVSIDIIPGDQSNIINTRKKMIAVAILSTQNFDALKNIDQTSLTFGATGSQTSLQSCARKARDINGDGLKDLLCNFWTQKAFPCDSGSGILKGKMDTGVLFTGSQPVTIQPMIPACNP